MKLHNGSELIVLLFAGHLEGVREGMRPTTTSLGAPSSTSAAIPMAEGSAGATLAVGGKNNAKPPLSISMHGAGMSVAASPEPGKDSIAVDGDGMSVSVSI
jgi:hypothetical protein